MSALVVQWGMAATRSLFITGADAVHYHVPYAVNIALGANPFGPTATPHLYPMGTSVTAAWFILPFRDPLLVDLAVLPAFLLAWLAVGRLVGLLTGRADLAWGPWCALLLFSTPLFRASLLMSADLFYAAAFLSVNALLLQVYSRSRVTAVELLSLGFATGMLLSAKVTGAFSAVLLFGLYGGAIVLRRVASGRRLALPDSWAGAGAAVAAVASGGIWLVRNWWAFGSPLAPAGFAVFGVEIFPGEKSRDARFLVSVLKDVRDEAWLRRARAAVVLDVAVVRELDRSRGSGRGRRLPGARAARGQAARQGGTRRARPAWRSSSRPASRSSRTGLSWPACSGRASSGRRASL